MRTTLSFTATPTEVKKTKQLARARGFETTSDYLRFLLRQDDVDLIGEQELVRRMKEIPRLHKNGKLIRARSMADLLQ